MRCRPDLTRTPALLIPFVDSAIEEWIFRPPGGL